jgi:hypothetical protein
MDQIIKLSTEGDCEGRSTEDLGLFNGTIEQVVSYCVRNSIKPYYKFTYKTPCVIDVTDEIVTVNIKHQSYGAILYDIKEGVVCLQDKYQKALSKLTPEDKILLGL